MLDMSFLWLFVLVVAVFIEVITPALISIWFAAGAVFALIAARAGLPVYAQVLIFAAVSLLLLFVVAKPLKNWLQNNKRTNIPYPDDILGKTGRVTAVIVPPEFGRVRIGDVEYEAASHRVIPQGELIRVVGRDGIRLVVDVCGEQFKMVQN